MDPVAHKWIQRFEHLHFQGIFAAALSQAFWPGRRLLHVLAHLAHIERQVASAQTWVDGCHTMIAKGVPSPLDDALAQVDRLSREREGLSEQLRSLGYAARFRRGC